MKDLAWMTDHQFQRVVRNEHTWRFGFDHSVYLDVACLWRLLEAGRIRVTSKDDGHQFGLPAPVDAAAEANSRLTGAKIEAVALRKGSLDLDIRFSTGHVLQVIPESAGYEAWTVLRQGLQFIAVGGGELYGDEHIAPRQDQGE